MDNISSSFTVLFEKPFWIGIYEREYHGKYEVCKITFGAEPKDYEVYTFLLNNFESLRFSPSIEVEKTYKKRINPKRMHREIIKNLSKTEPSTKAQLALQTQREQLKTERKHYSKEMKILEKKRQFDLKQEKKKEKHKGH